MLCVVCCVVRCVLRVVVVCGRCVVYAVCGGFNFKKQVRGGGPVDRAQLLRLKINIVQTVQSDYGTLHALP